VERASALVEHPDGRLEVIDVEAMLRAIGWQPDHAEEPEALQLEEAGERAA
jgi:hypothetical protein